MARIKPTDPYQWESMRTLRASNPIDSLLQVMEYFSNRNREEKESRSGSYAVAYNEFYKDIHGASDLDVIDTEIGRMKAYFNQNKDNMDVGTIENFKLLSKQADYHKQDTSMYKTGLSEMNKKGDNYLNLVEEYNDAPDEATMPLVLEKGVRTKDMIAEELNASIVDYINWTDKFNSKYGDKLNTAKFSTDKARIDSLDDIMRASIGMISDKHFSNEEKMMLVNAVNQKSMAPLESYIDIKKRVKVADANSARERGRLAVDIVNKNAKLLDAQSKITKDYEDIILMTAGPDKRQEWNRIKDKPVYLYDYTDIDGESYKIQITNEDILNNFFTNPDTEDQIPLTNVINKSRFEMDDAMKEFENADRVYMNTVGESITKNYPIMYNLNK